MKQILYSFLILISALGACQKSFLETKSSQDQKVPVTLSDYQAIFDNSISSDGMNARSAHILGIVGSDEYFLSEGNFNTLPSVGVQAYGRNGYIWGKDIYMSTDGFNVEPYDFTTAYSRILRCNIVLQGLNKIPITEENKVEWNNIKGSAYFYRALNYYNLCQLYTQPLVTSSFESLGLPLRIDPDPTLKINRVSVDETYTLIKEDLKQAQKLLPLESLNIFRPSELAVHALWARLYLQKQDYEAALRATDKIMGKNKDLINYNEIRLTDNYSFPLYGLENKEVIFSTAAYNFSMLSNNFAQVDSVLYDQYDENDLRQKLFFKKSIDNRVSFWGSYNGNNMFFTGFAMDEVYLIRAEALVRLGKTRDACETLNTLLQLRYVTDSYQDYFSDDRDEVLDKILLERRKQLIFRGVRWEDLRRLNVNPETEKTLVRLIGDKEYELQPNSKRYVWPFPPEAISIGGFDQNER